MNKKKTMRPVPNKLTLREVADITGMTPQGVQCAEIRAINKLFMAYVVKYKCTYTEAFQKLQKLLDTPYEDFYNVLDDRIKITLREENE